MVDPLMRISIPAIRQHPWFNNYLPPYLAIPPIDTTKQAKKVRTFPYNIVKKYHLYVFVKFHINNIISRLKRR